MAFRPGVGGFLFGVVGGRIMAGDITRRNPQMPGGGDEQVFHDDSEDHGGMAPL